MADHPFDFCKAWSGSGSCSRRTTARLLAAVVLGAAAPASARSTKTPFQASFAGTFDVTGGAANSPLFDVEESGTGEEDTLGPFAYTLSVRQNSARVPNDCRPGSSTGVDGSAVLTFADGELRLKRTSGTACFAFPTITIDERWTISSGTGHFAGATGKLDRNATGDVRFGTIDGTLIGAIKLVRS